MMDQISIFEDSPTIEGLQAAFGITQEDSSVPEALDEEKPTEEQPQEEPAEPQQEAPQVESPPASPEPSPSFNKELEQFKAQNEELMKGLKATAQVLGINPNLRPDQLSAAIQQQANIAIAKANNMDPAILQRLNQLEAINAKYQAAENEKILSAQMNDLMSNYGVTKDELQSFVNTLEKEQYDPFAPGNSVVTEYLKRNFKTMQDKAVKAAVLAEQQRSAKGSNASQPTKASGQNADASLEKPIETQSAFDDWMNSLLE